MGTLIAVHQEIKALLVAAGVDADFGPRKDAPAVSVTIWPTAGVERYTSHRAQPSDRMDRADLTVTARTTLDALVLASKVRIALAGKRLTASGANGGTLYEDSFTTEPTPDVAADPQRVNLPLSFAIVTQGVRQ